MKLATAWKRYTKAPLPPGWCPECFYPACGHWVGTVCRDCHERNVRNAGKAIAGVLGRKQEMPN